MMVNGFELFISSLFVLKRLLFMTGIVVLPLGFFSSRARQAIWPIGEFPGLGPHLGEAFAAYLAVLLMPRLFVRLLALVKLHGISGGVATWLAIFAVDIFMMCLTVACTVAVMKHATSGRLAWPVLSSFKREHLASGLAGFACMTVFTLVAAIFMREAPMLQRTAHDGMAILPKSNTSLMLFRYLMVVVVVPLVEESFYRGVLFAGMYRMWGGFPAALASTALFAAGHGPLTVVIPTFILGWTCSWLYMRTGSLWPGIVVHVINNSNCVLPV